MWFAVKAIRHHSSRLANLVESESDARRNPDPEHQELHVLLPGRLVGGAPSGTSILPGRWSNRTMPARFRNCCCSPHRRDAYPCRRNVCAGRDPFSDLRRGARRGVRRLLPDHQVDAGDAGLDSRSEGRAAGHRRAGKGVLSRASAAKIAPCRRVRSSLVHHGAFGCGDSVVLGLASTISSVSRQVAIPQLRPWVFGKFGR